MSISGTQDTIPIQTSGITAFIATDYIGTGGITGHYQLIKLAYGVANTATMVNSSSPLPVSISAGLTATIAGFTGTFTVQGVGGGTPVPVTGTVNAIGLTSSPVYVKTHTGSQIEVTGGIPLTQIKDAISVYGPSGITYIYAHLVDQAGRSLSYSNGALNVNITGATISATIPSLVTVTGLSGATAISTTVGNTVGINDTNIVAGITAVFNRMGTMGGTLDAIYNALSVFGLVRPTNVFSGLISTTTGATAIGGGAGFTCYAGINFKALGTNTDLIYLGSLNVGTSFGYQLEPGENVFLNVGNINKVYAQARTGTQTLSFFAS